MRPTSHVATAQPAPVKNPTQAQTIISSRLTFVGILFLPSVVSAIVAVPPLLEIRHHVAAFPIPPAFVRYWIKVDIAYPNARPLPVCSFDTVRCPILSLGGGHEATRVHHASWWRGGGNSYDGSRSAISTCSCWRAQSRGAKDGQCQRPCPRSPRAWLC